MLKIELTKGSQHAIVYLKDGRYLPSIGHRMCVGDIYGLVHSISWDVERLIEDKIIGEMVCRILLTNE